jgi:uncharacterized protein (DUF433 family)
MQLEDYFEFEKNERYERIRVKGTRISLEHVLVPFKEGASPEDILGKYYPSLTLEQIYAVITYYLHNKQEMEAYLKRGEETAEKAYQEYLRQEPPEVVKRIKAKLAEQRAGVVQHP